MKRRYLAEGLERRDLMAVGLDFCAFLLDSEPEAIGVSAAGYYSRAAPSSLSPRTATPVGGTVPVRPNNGGFQIDIVPSVSIRNTAGALAAIERAVAQWESRIFDPITVSIEVNFAPPDTLPGNVLGIAQPTVSTRSYSEVRQAMVRDSGREGDDSIVAFLPEVGQLNLALPAGVGSSGNISLTKANLKALGLHSDQDDFETVFTDGRIILNPDIGFDFHRTDGIGAGQFDFETVMTHEIGHILGFVSAVDTIDGFAPNAANPQLASATPLDLYRFSEEAGSFNPRVPAAFSQMRRELRPSVPAAIDFLLSDGWDTIGVEYPVELGNNNGFGYQASHWQDVDLHQQEIGVMKPTVAPQTIVQLSNVDLRALDLIGYDILPPNIELVAPRVNDDQLTFRRGSTGVIDVLANDQNGTYPFDLATVVFPSGPFGGTVAYDFNTGFVVYTPRPGFSGADLFTYRVADAHGFYSQTATVTVNVIDSEVFIGPLAVDDLALARQGQPVNIQVLANDNGGGSPLRPDSLAIARSANHGNLDRNPLDGTIRYTPQPNFVGEDSFEYTVANATATSAPATVRIVVGAPLTPETIHSDVDGDGQITPLDALLVINRLNLSDAAALAEGESVEFNATSETSIYDVNRDGQVTPMDALVVINVLNRPG